MNIISFICVGIGGALGAMSRYSLSLFIPSDKFPYATLAANVLGCLVIGVLASWGVRTNLSSNATMLLKTGFCGGFTTFSTFSLETMKYFQTGDYILGSVYILVSVVACLLGVWIGMKI
ncbi:MAG: fluoride efflux transporter CrcB [Paludibacteraceae bacterium]|nr:fluoride efflux transporter CrcB [Paludibacteraceae bacterium]